MRFSVAVAAIAAPVLSVVAQQNILVTVGGNDLLAFNPPNITANNGDTVTFQFQSKNHSVTQSTFANPCSIQTTPAQGIDSGFQLVSPNATQLPEWSFTVTNASTPLWFFCAQTIPAVHCHAGMVFSVNANPDSVKSFAIYQANAMALGNAAAAGSAIASGAAAATSAVGSAIGGAIGAATSLAGDATSAAGAAAGAAATDAASAAVAGASALTAGAAALTAGASSSAPSASATGNSTTPGNGVGRVSSSAVSMLAAVGLAAGLLL